MDRQAGEGIIYLYGRLSSEDKAAGDSNSIVNQRKILTKYAEDNGFTPYEFIYDDGYSGADFNRPAFARMIEDVEAGKVATVIVKDMSRFGRDYLKVGFYMEILFPKKDVRLIAVSDNVDTLRGENDFTPMMNLFNEWYVRNTSRKIRAVWQVKGKSGDRLGVIPPYGYRKNPENKNRLLIDEESADVVRRIFRLCVDGHGPAQIARILNKEYILNPSAYKHEHRIIQKARSCKDPYLWSTSTVSKILDAPEYIGQTVNFKTWSKSYKDKKIRFNPPENQLIFYGTHKAIIDPETWDTVRRMREHKRRVSRCGAPGLFSGTLYCSDCKSKLSHQTRVIWNTARTESRLEGSYTCSKYRKDIRQLQERECTAHFIREAVLEQLVIEELRELLLCISRNENQFIRRVAEESRQEHTWEIAAKERALAGCRRRAGEIDGLIERLYADNASGKVPDERYGKMSARFEAEQAALLKARDALEVEIAGLEEKAANMDLISDMARRYTEVRRLTPAIVHEFIDRIIIHEPEQKRKNRRQAVDIIYNNIGAANPADRHNAGG